MSGAVRGAAGRWPAGRFRPGGIAFGFFYAIEKNKHSGLGVALLLGFTFFMGLMLTPLLHLRFLLSDQLVDLFRDPVDIAIRYGLDVDASYVALPLAPRNRKVLVASPRYLARCGQPQTPEDLRDHQCLLYMQQGRLYDKWRLGTETVQVGGTLLSDDADVARRWAVAGEGITYKSWLDVSDDVLAGRLVLLMPDHPGPALPLSLVCPHRKQLSPTVTRLHAWLFERFAGLPNPGEAAPSTR